MEPGTKFCIDHPDIKIPEFADECPICNKQVSRQADGVVALSVQEELSLPLSDPPDFEGAGPDPADHSQEETFKDLHERITTKIEEKKKVRNGRTRT